MKPTSQGPLGSGGHFVRRAADLPSLAAILRVLQQFRAWTESRGADGNSWWMEDFGGSSPASKYLITPLFLSRGKAIWKEGFEAIVAEFCSSAIPMQGGKICVFLLMFSNYYLT